MGGICRGGMREGTKKGLSCTTHPRNPSFHLIFGGCSTRNAIFMYYPPERNPIIRNNQGPNTSRQQETRHPTSLSSEITRARTQAGTKRAEQPPGLSCAACFEQLAGVLASCDAFPPVPSHPTPTNCIRRQNTLTTNGKTTTQLCSTCKILSPDDPGNCMLLLIRESVYG